MTKNRNISDLLDANGDVKSGALDNVPASNDASALTTGTLPIARIADGDVATAKIADGAITSAKLASGVGGKVLQVVFNDYQTRISTTSTSFTEATGLATSITPSSTSNKVLIMGTIQMGNSVGTGGNIQIKRDSTIIGKSNFKWWYIPHADSGLTLSYTFLDTPSSTSAISYKLFYKSDNGADVFINSSGNYGGNANEEGSSQITLMEIAG